ncbi:Mpr protein [Asanoa ishikariensis]|uniref:DUF4352 domain-containing protein n=1 Tax=Asanoa ishikariensis TaxID=137265 RepID=A0A1H3T455_9ACTN|nr:DUF4352 domain-containing protein [Asanoa ishikariensis]GIF63060.1 Mpr protein [Asanoa ishikariensis]SDZ44668.1 protein of unknown function [Asanoa ishikariensis]
MTYQPPPPSFPPPGFPPPGGVPHFGPPPAKKRSKTPWIVGGFVVLLLCCGGVGIAALNAGGDDPTTDTVTAAGGTVDEAPPKVSTPGLNEAARDGKFEFKVSKVACGTTRVGNSMIGEDALGVYCLVDLSVRNIGNKSQMFDGSSQKAFDGDGTEFSHDGAAGLYANDGTDVFLQDINPGNQLKGTLVFDVPKGTKLTTVELHDSPFSGGVTVALK